jgi:(2Fe-2S) ferredoxin
MLKSGTHYEQVSLAVVRKIVEQQTRRESTIEQDQGTTKKTLEDDRIEKPQRIVAGSGSFSERES